MKTRTAIGTIAGALLVPLIVFAGATSASASSDSANDDTNDVERAEGVSKSETSDLNRVTLKVDNKRVEVTLRFENLRTGTVKIAEASMTSDQYQGTDFRALMVPKSYESQGIKGDGLYFLDEDEQTRSAKGCDFDVAEKTGNGGTITMSWDRDCMKPNGGNKTTKGVELDYVGASAQKKNSSQIWIDQLFRTVHAKV